MAAADGCAAAAAAAAAVWPRLKGGGGAGTEREQRLFRNEAARPFVAPFRADHSSRGAAARSSRCCHAGRPASIPSCRCGGGGGGDEGEHEHEHGHEHD